MKDCARLIHTQHELGLQTGIVIAVPIPSEQAMHSNGLCVCFGWFLWMKRLRPPFKEPSASLMFVCMFVVFCSLWNVVDVL